MDLEKVKLHRLNLERFSDEIGDAKVAMVVTTSPAGQLVPVPMATLSLEMDGSLNFFVAADSSTAHNIRVHPQLAVTICHEQNNVQYAICGHGTLIQDPLKFYDYWIPIYRGWFPKGVDDPNLRLLRVDIDEIDRWESGTGPEGTSVTSSFWSVVFQEPSSEVHHEHIQLN